MTREQLQAAARQAAQAHGLDPALVMAVCHHESGNWNTWAVRYEPAFHQQYIASMKGLTSTEMQLRATSFGLMQVMGQTAREQGFDEKYLTALCDPTFGLEQGCVKLAKCLARKDGNVQEALLMYNGGSNPGYPDLVLQYYAFYAGEKL